MLLESSGDVAAPATGATELGSEVGLVGSNSGEEGDRSFGGNRWPMQETLALLKIRSDMDSTFRDSSLKGPSWEEVSRKLAELGYNRSGKKCKEKFENVYKYHKRTREGRTGKSDGKSYRFFDQLEALENLHSLPSPPSKLPHQINFLPSPPSKPHHQITTMPTTTIASSMPWNNAIPISTTNNIIPQNSNIVITPKTNPTITISTPPPPTTTHGVNPYPSSIFPIINLSSNLFSSSTSSSTDSDEEYSGGRPQGNRRNKRKWKDFFKRLTKEVIEKQEELQNKFLETIEKREHERIAREEAWRIQEMARINREHKTLVQERSAAAAKDSAVIAFLQKISGQQPENPPPEQQQQQQRQEKRAIILEKLDIAPKLMDINGDCDNDHHHHNVVAVSSNLPSPSRWPKAEVDALIMLRTNLDVKYRENNGPKGALWEDISVGMRKLGYNRSAKRCKEKWENINKYFKKVKESNKKRPEDSKTCPYFQQLDALYRKKNTINNGNHEIKLAADMGPLMVRPEQQWLQPQLQQAQPVVAVVDMERENEGQIQDEEEYGDSDEDEDEGTNFEIVANKAASIMDVTSE